MKTFPIYKVENFSCRHTDAELYVNTFSEHLKTHPFIEQPHRHDSHLLVFFTNGSGKHEIDFDVFEVHAGSLFVLQPGQMHNWELSADVKGFIVIFSSALYNLYFGNKRLEEYPFYEMQNTNPQLLIAEESMPEIIDYFNLLVKVSQENQHFRQGKILNILDCIHIEMMSRFQFQPHSLPTYNTKIKQFSALLETYFRSEKSASFYASRLNITLKHLNRICQETLKKTATQVIAERLVLEAKRQLMHPDLSVNAIADSIGFDDYSYFTRFFRKNTGTTPVKFRQSKNKPMQIL